MDSNSASKCLLQWSSAQASGFGRVAQTSLHRVHELPWWDDAGLARLIGRQPREQLRVFQSGVDPKQRHRDHQPVDTEGASPEDILEAVKRGKLWVNLQRIETAQPDFANLGQRLYDELQNGAPHFRPVWTNRAFLFISSPGAMVYLHADYQPNMLWHLRGNKTIWIYPAYDHRIVSLERIEEICAGGEDDIEYEYAYDKIGTPFEIDPGTTVSWPARSPHRVINGDNLNVSLSTFHETADDYQRVLGHRADFLLRTKVPNARGLFNVMGPSAKRLAYLAMERAGWAKGRPVKEYWARLRIDPNAPSGVREIPGGPILTEHSRLVQEKSARKAA